MFVIEVEYNVGGLRRRGWVDDLNFDRVTPVLGRATVYTSQEKANETAGHIDPGLFPTVVKLLEENP